jgi:hypothetical protein
MKLFILTMTLSKKAGKKKFLILKLQYREINIFIINISIIFY